MPTIVMCSTKGGVGKSTTALILAQTYAASNASVCLIDADPNQPLATWANRFAGAVPDNLTVIGSVNEETIVDIVEDASEKYQFVIVDLEGSANLTASYAISRADLVLIPMRGKQLDADQASRIIALIEREIKAYRRRIPYRIVFSMVSALQSREHRFIRTDLEKREIPILPAAMVDRAAFSAVFQIGGTIYDLTAEEVSNPQAAWNNAREVAAAVAEAIREDMQ